MNRFQTMSQTFYQFPNPEFKWNLIDNIIMSNISHTAYEDNKNRRLRYSIVPDRISNEKEMVINIFTYIYI